MTGINTDMPGQEYSDEDFQALLAQVASNSLPPEERQRVEAWLLEHPQQQAQVEFWGQLRVSLQSRPQLTPGQNVWQGLHQQVALHQRQGKRSLISAAAGLALATLSLVLLWLTIRPGVMLYWSVSGGDNLTYQVYRAPTGSQEFILLGEVPGSPGVNQYSYLDALFLPGRSYIYRVEGVSPSGTPVVSQRVVSQSTAALPGQMAILLASLLVGYLATSLARNWGTGKPTRLAPV